MPSLYHFNSDQFKENLILGGQQHMVAGRLCQYLKGWQLDGIRFLYKHFEKGESCILNDESGLGKVVTTAVFLGAVLSNDTTKKCLIIVRDDEHIEGWRFHLSVLTQLSVKVIERTSDINHETVFLIKWSTIKDIGQINKTTFDHIIVDNRGEMLTNKFCTGILLRYYETKISIVISSIDVTSDISLLHILLRLCGRLDKQYADLKLFEAKFQLPALKEGVCNKIDLEDYFLKREKVINFCREFRLRRYRHQFEEQFPLVPSNDFKRHLQQWRSKSNSQSSGSAKLCSSSSEKDVEELFQVYFRIKQERNDRRNECPQQKKPPECVACDDDNRSNSSDELVVMSPLLFLSESESDREETQLNMEPLALPSEEIKEEEEARNEQPEPAVEKEVVVSTVNRRKLTKPVKKPTPSAAELYSGKSLRSRKVDSASKQAVKSVTRDSLGKVARKRGRPAKQLPQDDDDGKEARKESLTSTESATKLKEKTTKKVNRSEDRETDSSASNMKGPKDNDKRPKRNSLKTDQTSKKNDKIPTEESKNKGSTGKATESAARPKLGTAAKPAESAARLKLGTAAKPESAGRPKQGTTAKPTEIPTEEPKNKGSTGKASESTARPKLGTTAKPSESEGPSKLGTAAKPSECEGRPKQGTADKPSESAPRPKLGKTDKPSESEGPQKLGTADKLPENEERPKLGTAAKSESAGCPKQDTADKPEITARSKAGKEEDGHSLPDRLNNSSKPGEKKALDKLHPGNDKRKVDDNKRAMALRRTRSKLGGDDEFETTVKVKKKKPNDDDGTTKTKQLKDEENQRRRIKTDSAREQKKPDAENHPATTSKKLSRNVQLDTIIAEANKFLKTKSASPTKTPSRTTRTSEKSPISASKQRSPNSSKKSPDSSKEKEKDKSEAPHKRPKPLTVYTLLGVHSKSTRGMQRYTRSSSLQNKYMKVSEAQVGLDKLSRPKRRQSMAVERAKPSPKDPKPDTSHVPESSAILENMQLGQALTPTNGCTSAEIAAPIPKNGGYNFPLMLDKEIPDTECIITSQDDNRNDVIILTGSSTMSEMEPPKTSGSRRTASANPPMVTIPRHSQSKARSPDLFSTCSDLSLPCYQEKTTNSTFDGFKIFGSELRQALSSTFSDATNGFNQPRADSLPPKNDSAWRQQLQPSPTKHPVEDEDAMFEITTNGTFSNMIRVNSNGEMSPIRNKNQSTPPGVSHQKNRITNYLISSNQLVHGTSPSPSLDEQIDSLQKTPKRRKSLSGTMKRSPRGINGLGKMQSTKLTQWLIKNNPVVRISDKPLKASSAKRKRLDLLFPDDK